MIDPAYAQTLARYNRWQNDSLYAAAASLTDAQRRQDRGAFFASIHASLNHVLFGDAIWMSRFEGVARPEGVFPGTDFCDDWEKLQQQRAAMDGRIVAWADGLAAAALSGELSWVSRLQNTQIIKPFWLAVTHFFNHQTHHRGQVHAMLTAAGAKPRETDLIFMTAAAE
jgi:uncharacterized damage-inducible protein DinB